MRIFYALKSDILFQFKQGFYIVYFVVTLLYLLLISQLPESFVPFAVPLIIYSDPTFLGFFFIGGILMLEKFQGVVDYLIITPLSSKEYVVAKVLSLGLIAEFAGFLIAIFSMGFAFHGGVLFIGILLTAAFFTLYGIFVAENCRSLNHYFMKMIPFMLVIVLPTILYFIFPRLWFLRALPSVGGFHIVHGAFHGISIYSFLLESGYLFLVNIFAFRGILYVMDNRREGGAH